MFLPLEKIKRTPQMQHQVIDLRSCMKIKLVTTTSSEILSAGLIQYNYSISQVCIYARI